VTYSYENDLSAAGLMKAAPHYIPLICRVVPRMRGQFVEVLRDRLQFATKLLGRTAEIPRTRALESISQAFNFQSWHEFHSYLGLSESAASDDWANRLGWAWLVLEPTDNDEKLSLQRIAAAAEFAKRLSALTGVEHAKLQNHVCAALHSARSWKEVLDKHPLDTLEPLYVFEADASDKPLRGSFQWSKACGQLVEELDSQWQGYDKKIKPKQKEARQWVESALSRQPGFLEGGLALAQIQYSAEEYSDAIQTCEAVIAQADALMPKGFKGQISWYETNNRFYHRLLYLGMKLNHGFRDYAQALRLARKQLRLNPSDNLVLRHLVPLLLLRMEDYPRAHRACSQFKKTAEHDEALICAFCNFAVGDMAGFKSSLARSLLTLPLLRRFLLDTDTLPPGEKGTRGVVPDLEAISVFGWPAYEGVPGLRAACVEFLTRPVVLKTEEELCIYWNKFWKRDGTAEGSHEKWRALMEAGVDRISK
jgi:tetratricopeptide (TPR) repeat protein